MELDKEIIEVYRLRSFQRGFPIGFLYRTEQGWDVRADEDISQQSLKEWLSEVFTSESRFVQKEGREGWEQWFRDNVPIFLGERLSVQKIAGINTEAELDEYEDPDDDDE